MRDAFIGLIATCLKHENFTLVDVGCSGGIEPIWRLFGQRFAAVGFDASVSECRRLQAEETNPNVHYLAGFVGLPTDHPFAVYSAGKPEISNELFLRTSAVWTRQLQAEALKAATDHERMQRGFWPDTELADPNKPVFVPQALAERGYDTVDFLKIDIDGPDFKVLNSFDGLFEKLGIIGVRLEVNMHGGTGDTMHTFPNTDLFMRRSGYELVSLDSRHYSMRALPARFAITMPAQTVRGRILQAEAFYVRDIAGAEYRQVGAALSNEKILKLAAIFSAWDQPDGAAEILVTYRERLSTTLDIDKALDLLAAQTQYADGEKDEVEILSYRDYMAAFAADSPEFYPAPHRHTPKPKLLQRLRAAWTALDDWSYVDHRECLRERERMLDDKRRARRLKKAD
jgi:hypothetical protein